MRRASYLVLVAMLLAPPIVMGGNHSNVILSGGQMKFQGKIIAEACSVETDSQDFTVEMGQVRSNQFHDVGMDVNPTPFDIHLRDCNTFVSQTVSIQFHGVADSKNPQVLSVGEGSGVAGDIGVALFDATNSLIAVNSSPRVVAVLQPGPVTLHFTAKYRAVGPDVTGGKANAQGWFALTYL